MTHAAHNRTLLTLVVTLSSVLFVADLFMPLGIAIGVLYAGVVLVAAGSSNARLPFITATASTPLIVLGQHLVRRAVPFPCGSASPTESSA